MVATKLGALDMVMAEYFRDALGTCVGNVSKLPHKFMTVHWLASNGVQLPQKPRFLFADERHGDMPGAAASLGGDDAQLLDYVRQSRMPIEDSKVPNCAASTCVCRG